MRKILAVSFSLSFLVLSCFAQDFTGVRIGGVVRDSLEGKPVEGANVMLGRPGTFSVYQYVITGKDGRFGFVFTGAADSLRITVSAFDMKMRTVRIPAKDTLMDIRVVHAPLKLQAAVVTYAPIKRRNDTLVYNVESFRTASDRTIGEVIGKMPGLSVAKSGNITYNGERISNFYIEGLDMMEARYGVAVNGIRAEDIEAVEVMESHHHEKIYQNKGLPGKPAINLRLKDGAKGTWSGSLMAGAGYGPWMWDGEAKAMFFGKNFQTFDIYKTNNIGRDDSYGMFSGVASGSFPMLSVKKPDVPPFDTERYLDNNSHAVSANAISRVGEELNLRTNVQYMHDSRRYEGLSSTVYHLSGNDSFEIDEDMYSSSMTDRFSVGADIEKNNKKFYLKDKLNLAGAWNGDYGKLVADGEDVSQKMKYSDMSISNDFSIRWTGKSFTWSADSETSYTSSPGSLCVAPLLYDIFTDSTGAAGDFAGLCRYVTGQEPSGIMQDLAVRKLSSSNAISGMYGGNGLNLFLTASADMNFWWMNSRMSPLYDTDLYGTGGGHESGGTVTAEAFSGDSDFLNDIYRHDMTLSVRPNINWSVSGFSISAVLPVAFKDIRFNDALHGKSSGIDKVYVNPYLRAEYKISYELSVKAFASYNESYGGLYDNYHGYIMTDYRNISRREGDVSVSRSRIYGAGLKYANTVAALFLNADLQYGCNWRNQTYSVSYDGILAMLESVPEPSYSRHLGVSGDISKRFFAINTTLKLSGGYNCSWQRLLRQGEYYPMTYSNLGGSFELLSDFSRWGTAEYSLDASRSVTSTSVYGVESSSPIVNLRQKLLLRIIPVERLFLEASWEHYYNDNLSGDKSMFYLDASVSYKWRKFEFVIEMRNLLNSDVYRSSVFSDVTMYTYSYGLRPLGVLMKVMVDL